VHLDDEGLRKLLAAAQAEPDPALWTRARARIEQGARARTTGRLTLWEWLARPAAVAVSLVVLLATAGAGYALRDHLAENGAITSASLVEWLLQEDGSAATPASPAAPVAPAPRDSGGRS
jgi:hypothetical protein